MKIAVLAVKFPCGTRERKSYSITYLTTYLFYFILFYFVLFCFCHIELWGFLAYKATKRRENLTNNCKPGRFASASH